MASLFTQDFTTLVRNTVTAIQASASTLLDLTVGSALRAVVEANAGVMLWLQGLIVQVLVLTRAATSNDDDLDSWYADFDFERLKARYATGPAIFSRFTATQQAIIPFGQVIQTQDGTQSFTVITDPANSSYNAVLGGYVLAPGVTSAPVGVIAVNAGTQGNVLAGTITSISQGIDGIDTVTNPADFTTGVDAESNTDFRKRFPLYIASLSKATKVAIQAAIANVQQGLQCTLTENTNYDGSPSMGFIYAVIDDGTGSPSSTLLTAVGNAIDAVRGLTHPFAVFAPIIAMANVTMVITTASGYNHATVVGQVGTAMTNFINAIPLGQSLPYTQLAAIAYGVDGVTNVSGVLLNGATADLVLTNQQKVRAGLMVLS